MRTVSPGWFRNVFAVVAITVVRYRMGGRYLRFILGRVGAWVGFAGVVQALGADGVSSVAYYTRIERVLAASGRSALHRCARRWETGWLDESMDGEKSDNEGVHFVRLC